MSEINVPELRSALKYLAELNSQMQESLIQAFESAPPAISLDRLAASVAASVKQPVDSVRSVAYAVSSLLLVSDTSDGARLLSEALTQHFAPKEKAAALVPVMSRFLACEQSIGVTGKAQSIMWGHGQTYKNARVITQIRPVYHLDPKTTPQHATIVHELTIERSSQEGDSVVTILLDQRQLKELRKVLLRAITKEKTLRNEEGGFTYLASEGEYD